MFRIAMCGLLLGCATGKAVAQEGAFGIDDLRFFDEKRGSLSKPLPLPYSGGFLLVDAKWATKYTDKDDVTYRAWIRSETGDFASANAPKGKDETGVTGWRQYLCIPPVKAGGTSRVRIRLACDYRRADLPSFPLAEEGKEKSVLLPEALPLKGGVHRFTFCVQRIRPGAEPETATKEFEIEIRGDESQPVFSGIAEYQVFQRKSKTHGDLAFYVVAPGTAEVSATVKSGDKSLATASATVSATNRRVVLPDVPVGGPYTVEISAGDKSARFDNVFVGDLWILGGQSNAAGCGYDQSLGRKPMEGVNGLSPRYGICQWRPAKDGFFEQTVGPWVTAAQEFTQATKVPVGLMGHAVGGRPMDYFLDPQTQEMCFLKPLVEAHGQGAAAFFWYQGESDAFQPETQAAYGKKLDAMAASMRRCTRNENLVIGIVQLGRYTWHKDDHFAAIRETQRQFVLRDGKSVLFSTLPYEVNAKDKIHLTTPGYIALGKQVAAQMIQREQEGKLQSPGPIVEGAKFEGADRKRIVVRFRNADGLTGGDSADQWYVTDRDHAGFREGGFVELGKVTVDSSRGQVVLDLKAAPAGPAAVSYGYRCDVGGTLQNGKGLPAVAFVKIEVAE